MPAKTKNRASASVRLVRSGIHGRGLVAGRPIGKGERVIEYVGERVTKAEGARRQEEQAKRRRHYIFELNARHDIDGSVRRNIARFANHSCDPNCESDVIRGHIWIIALQDIARGEEITYDYNFDFDDEPVRCRCGAKKCRGFIVGEDDQGLLRRWMARRQRPPTR
ncbi:MAG: SET domain-containing protein-lysine N-methyltransferase [Euryarchaeota archaeon]|nr:SET domain-containing protein-lysine N-methyltransferase [Euryarchaeota archaeon]